MDEVLERPPVVPASTALLAEIDAALALTDRVAANRAVTRAHHHLAVAIDAHLGGDAGATFHAWATWGSQEAGRTVAKRDVPHLLPIGAVAAFVVGAAGGLGFGLGAAALLVGAVCALAAGAGLWLGLERSSKAIATGNRIVLDDIGRVSARFLEVRTDDDLAALVASLTPDQAGLGKAMALYLRTRNEHDRSQRHQLAFAASCLALRHEHVRLQPWISRALVPGTRRLFTATLLRYRIGTEHLHVGREVPPFHGADAPPTLAIIDEPAAIAVVDLMRIPGRTQTAATRWTDYAQRMHHAEALFRSRHLDPELLDPALLD